MIVCVWFVGAVTLNFLVGLVDKHDYWWTNIHRQVQRIQYDGGVARREASRRALCHVLTLLHTFRNQASHLEPLTQILNLGQMFWILQWRQWPNLEWPKGRVRFERPSLSAESPFVPVVLFLMVVFSTSSLTTLYLGPPFKKWTILKK